MTYNSFELATTFTLLLVSTELSAHHSLLAEFRTDSPTEITGVITDMDWINPHSYLYVDVTDEAGNVVNWHLEEAPPCIERDLDHLVEPLHHDNVR